MPYLPDQDLGQICLGLSTLLHAGMDLSYGAGMLPAMKGPAGRAVESLKAALAGGSSLSDALDPDAFPPYAMGLVRVGEGTGRLEQALDALSSYYYKKHARNERIRSALTYPIVLSVMMLAVIGTILARILPVFDRVYASLGGGMDGLAGVLLDAGLALDAAMPAVLAVLGALVLALVLVCACRPLRARAVATFLSRYGDKGLFRGLNDARFAQALSMGLSSGMPLDEAVVLAAGTGKGIPGAEARYGKCADMARDGLPVTEALSKSRALPEDACAMLELAQAAGSLDAAMANAADLISDKADRAIDEASARIEPALVIAACAATGIILLSVMLPLMDIMAAMG